MKVLGRGTFTFYEGFRQAHLPLNMKGLVRGTLPFMKGLGRGTFTFKYEGKRLGKWGRTRRVTSHQDGLFTRGSTVNT